MKQYELPGIAPAVIKITDESYQTLRNNMLHSAAPNFKSRKRMLMERLDNVSNLERHLDHAANLLEKENARAERIEKALKRFLLEFDFMIEARIIPDVRNDIIFVEAREALGLSPEPATFQPSSQRSHR